MKKAHVLTVIPHPPAIPSLNSKLLEVFGVIPHCWSTGISDGIKKKAGISVGIKKKVGRDAGAPSEKGAEGVSRPKHEIQT